MEFKINSKYGVPDNDFSMKYLSDLDSTDKEEKVHNLEQLVEAYKTWIDELAEKSTSLENVYIDTANKNIEGCEKAFVRMRRGIEILVENEKAWDAFQLANRAMFMQRAHLMLQRETSNKSRYPYDEELTRILDEIDYMNIDERFKDRYSWRPFQIAFLLMSVESIVEDNSNDKYAIYNGCACSRQSGICMP